MNAQQNSVHARSRAAWRQWLQKHHTRTQGLWLITYKKASGKPRMAYEAAVEEALCFGWIDSKVNKLDHERSMLWMAPRKAKTGWSKPNKERVERLIESGLIMPAGLAKIHVAKKDGSWNALDAVEALTVPPDLRQALAAYVHARKHFDAFPRSVKRGILEWILNAKKAQTRARRVEETARLANDNLRANQWPRK